MQPPAILARRFVAGATAESAVAVGTKLAARGIKPTFDLLGEDVLEAEAARRIAAANEGLLRLIPDGVERNISIKLSSLGFDVSEELCLELVAGILGTAREVKGFVRIDMEGSKHTERTIRFFQRLRKDFDSVGIVLQAYLHRTPDDVEEAIRRGDRVRLCKGAYREPAEVALQEMPKIRTAFKACARRLMDEGSFPAIASHDEELVQDALLFAREQKLAASRFEFQMLYGLRPGRWDELVKDGWNFRVYVPYGTHWFPYFYRRLRERKENVFFVLRSLLGG